MALEDVFMITEQAFTFIGCFKFDKNRRDWGTANLKDQTELLTITVNPLLESHVSGFKHVESKKDTLELDGLTTVTFQENIDF